MLLLLPNAIFCEQLMNIHKAELTPVNMEKGTVNVIVSPKKLEYFYHELHGHTIFFFYKSQRTV